MTAHVPANVAAIALAKLPLHGYVRHVQLVGRAATETQPALPGMLPISGKTLVKWVLRGDFPRPVLLGGSSLAWHVEDVRAFLNAQCADGRFVQ